MTKKKEELITLWVETSANHYRKNNFAIVYSNAIISEAYSTHMYKYTQV